MFPDIRPPKPKIPSTGAPSAPPVPDGLRIMVRRANGYSQPPVPSQPQVSRVTDDAETPVDDERVDLPPLDDLPDVSKPGRRPNFLKRFFGGYWHYIWWTLPLTLVLIVSGLLAVPATRYPILALGLKRSFALTVTDGKTNTPISGAKVSLGGVTATTDGQGKARLTVGVGSRAVTVTKQYYKTDSHAVFVGISTAHNTADIRLLATGRQVPLRVFNKITGKPITDADISVLDTEAKTDAKGRAIIVLPTSATTHPVTITADGYNTLKTDITVTDKLSDANKFGLVPAGLVYLLSNAKDTIDVISTNLDGTAVKTIVAGTGKEDPHDTVLYASTDWKYLALLSNRTGSAFPQLYIISTSDGKLKAVEQGTSTNVVPLGWSNHLFVYETMATNLDDWQPGKTSLKSYDADYTKTVTIDKTTASGTHDDFIYQTLAVANLVKDRVVYGFAWSAHYGNTSMNVGGKTDAVMSAGADGGGRKDLRDITLPAGATYSYMNAILTKPDTLDIQYSVEGQPSVYYVYQAENNSVTQSSTITDASYANLGSDIIGGYVVSPSGVATLWDKPHNGRDTLFIGDANGQNGEQITNPDGYAPFGWLGDDYILVLAHGTQLFVMPVTGGTPVIITDFFRANPTGTTPYIGGYGGP